MVWVKCFSGVNERLNGCTSFPHIIFVVVPLNRIAADLSATINPLLTSVSSQSQENQPMHAA